MVANRRVLSMTTMRDSAHFAGQGKHIWGYMLCLQRSLVGWTYKTLCLLALIVVEPAIGCTGNMPYHGLAPANVTWIERASGAKERYRDRYEARSAKGAVDGYLPSNNRGVLWRDWRDPHKVLIVRRRPVGGQLERAIARLQTLLGIEWGTQVPLEVEPISGSLHLVRPEQGFRPGFQYEITQTYHDPRDPFIKHVMLEVVDQPTVVEPFDVVIGDELHGRQRVGVNCGSNYLGVAARDVRVELGEQLEPFIRFLHFETTVDDQPWRPILSDFGHWVPGQS